MKRVVAFAVVWLIATLTMGQSLGELAKREKKRRVKNQQEGVKVRELTEGDIQSAPPLVEAMRGELMYVSAKADGTSSTAFYNDRFGVCSIVRDVTGNFHEFSSVGKVLEIH